MSAPVLREERIVNEILRALRKSDPKAFIQPSGARRTHIIIDGTFNLQSVAKAVLEYLDFWP